MAVPQLPDISVQWDELEDSAADTGQRARVAADYLTDAATAWQRFRSFYQEPDTQERVYTALDDLQEPTENWQRSLQDAAGIISGFAAAGRALEQRVLELRSAVHQQQSQPETEEGQKDEADQKLTDQAAALSREWTDLQETTAAAISGISYGDGAGLPMGAVIGGSALPAVAWAALTSRLDDRFGALTPDELWPSLRGLDEAELREWAAANPEAAALLAGRTLTGPFRSGTPEALMRTAMADDAHLHEDGIAGIRSAWLDLSPQDQERLMLMYPAVFGSLNGVPFAQRAKANLITVPGFRHIAGEEREARAAVKEPQLMDYPLDDAGSYFQWQEAHQKWQAENDRLDNQIKGLDYALDNDTQVVMVTLEGDGHIVSMVGTPSSSTERMATIVPGTSARLDELGSYSERLATMTDPQSEKTVGFYWQGTDLPDEVRDNVTSNYNEAGAPLLAAFDYAVDLEIPDDAGTTYVGYSAGASLLGTGEREGLDSTNIVYIAPAGPGHEVGEAGDTANPDAHRYWLQTRDDDIHLAQDWGGGFHGPSFRETGMVDAMGVTRLETGFLRPENPESLMKGHNDYFVADSTAMANLRGVIDGTSVSLYVENEEIPQAVQPKIIVPIEENPEDYADGKLELVKVKDLEK